MENKKFTSDIVIGLEIHVELNTATKLFCGCPTSGSEDPNTRTCEVCLGFPGSKPVLNKKALEFALRLALALDCKINPELVFSRKSYFYPDMAKNYQISQYEIPLAVNGNLRLASGKSVGITRVHMEEDPASLIHPSGVGKSAYVLIDYNRSGNPLVEVVTEPDLESPDEAREFMNKLITILSYLEIFDVKKGIIKADANISIKESGYSRVEVKNVTGFKDIERALNYEVLRQKSEFKEGKKLVQETRSWDSDKGITSRLRLKETEADYGYIFDPDLVITDISLSMIEEIKKAMPELAAEKIEKYIKKLKIPKVDAEVIAQEKILADLFEKVSLKIDPILAAKWLRRELMRVVNYNKKELHDLELDETHLIDLLDLVQSKQITETTAQKLMEQLVEKPFNVKAYVKSENLAAVSDAKELEKFCKEAIAEAPQALKDYKSGNEKALHFVVGIVMRKTKGKATPKEVNEILKKLVQ